MTMTTEELLGLFEVLPDMTPRRSASIVGYVTRLQETARKEGAREALTSVKEQISREISKANRHIAEGTSIGGETAAWHETVIAAHLADIAIIDVAMR